jgi:HEAT repeat protein
MRCEEIHAHFADHLAGMLAPDVSGAVAEHLRTCRACGAEADGLNETWQMLGTVPADRPDSTAMRARFDAALDGYQHGLHVERMGPGRFSRLRIYGLQFAAAAAVLALGVGIGRQAAPRPAADPQLALLREELRDMRQMVTLSLLQQQSASERLKGVSFTTRIEQPGSEVTLALLDTLMHDANVNVRLATIDALKRFAARESVRRGVIEALARQTSPLVQIALIDFVVETNDRDAAGTLRHLLGDPMLDQAVRGRATQALKQIG